MTENAAGEHFQHPERMLAWEPGSVKNSVGRTLRSIMAWREPAMA